MRPTLLGYLQSLAIIGGFVAYGLAYAALAAPADPCANTHDPDLCRVERAAPDPTTDPLLPPLPCGVQCDTDTRCEEQARACSGVAD